MDQSSSSTSSHTPAFHSFNSSTGGSLSTVAMMRGDSSSVPSTPPNELAQAITRQSSLSSSYSSLPVPHHSMLMGQQITPSGSMHHIYQTNVLLTPSASLPSTPNHNQPLMYALPPVGAELSLAAASAMHAPLPKQATSAFGGNAAYVRTSPTGSPSQSPPLTAHKLGTSGPPMPSAAASSTIAFDMSDVSSPVEPTDEVANLRQMFRAPGLVLSKSIFTLGDTLGTGTFGR
jgi:hypothetical protein